MEIFYNQSPVFISDRAIKRNKKIRKRYFEYCNITKRERERDREEREIDKERKINRERRERGVAHTSD